MNKWGPAKVFAFQKVGAQPFHKPFRTTNVSCSPFSGFARWVKLRVAGYEVTAFCLPSFIIIIITIIIIIITYF